MWLSLSVFLSPLSFSFISSHWLFLPAFHFVLTRKGFSNLLQFGDCKTPGLFMRQSGPPLSQNYSITSSNPLSHKLSPIHRHNANLDGVCSCIFLIAIFLFYSILTLVCYLVLPQVVSNNGILSCSMCFILAFKFE
jgi:hypothetical protein